MTSSGFLEVFQRFSEVFLQEFCGSLWFSVVFQGF